jgi:hypothetical protein
MVVIETEVSDPLPGAQESDDFDWEQAWDPDYMSDPEVSEPGLD